MAKEAVKSVPPEKSPCGHGVALDCAPDCEGVSPKEAASGPDLTTKAIWQTALDKGVLGKSVPSAKCGECADIGRPDCNHLNLSAQSEPWPWFRNWFTGPTIRNLIDEACAKERAACADELARVTQERDNWKETARRYADNAEYWQKERDDLKGRLERLIGDVRTEILSHGDGTVGWKRLKAAVNEAEAPAPTGTKAQPR